MPESFDPTNAEMQMALDLISKTDTSFFLTGRAGTGKTTFLKNVRLTVRKNFVVVAPTGVAAINAGGKTIHSFFGLSLGILLPGETGTVNRDKFNLIRNVDTIIVDEVSMVRCDIMDAMDRTLRRVRQSSAPFGGVQMVFVGDMFQLEPVVTTADKAILMNIYGKGPYYFYKSNVISGMNLPKIEFKKIYRQNDPVFIGILENIRTGSVTTEDLSAVNTRVSPNVEEEGKLSITLTSTRKKAQEINDSRLASLDTEEKTYVARYFGKMNPNTPGAEVAEQNLVLKVGAQVMFTKNSRNGYWVNGTLGVVQSLSENMVEVKLENNQVYDVERDSWDNIEYVYDLKKNTCEQTVVGTLVQFPLRLAWAITIHKSQSLTFDRVSIDFGEKAFCNGQAYVALSRARSLDGLKLLRPMSLSSVMVSDDVMAFSSEVNDENIIRREMEIGEAIKPFVKKGDYDGAAVKLYNMAGEAYREGNIEKAYDLMMRSLSKVVDDDCLFGISFGSMDAVQDFKAYVFFAVDSFYSGYHPRITQEILCHMGNLIDNDINALYILSRCAEIREQWQLVEGLYNEMIALYSSLREKGLDSEAFRKVRYRLAILNEHHYGDPGASIMRDLIAENPWYNPFHREMRGILRLHDDIVAKGKEAEDNPLVSMLFSDEVSDDAFIEALSKERKEKSDAWKSYRSFISHLKLED